MDLIYHYTNTDGFMGILSPKSNGLVLWFTRYDCLNDKTEGTELKRILDLVSEKLFSDEVITNNEYEIIKNLELGNKVLYIKTYYGENKEPITRGVYEDSYKFILSFCKNPDSLEMWRYYSKKDQGYCLGFEKNALSIFTKVDPFNVDKSKNIKLSWHDVIYDNSKKEELIEDAIRRAKNDAIRTHKQFDKQYYISFVNALITEVENYQFSFKHNCFKNENETRAVISVPKRKTIFEGHDDMEIKFRTSNGMIIPYVEYEFPKKCLQSVMTSPTATEHMKSVTQDYIDNFIKDKSKKIMVQKSELPIRF